MPILKRMRTHGGKKRICWVGVRIRSFALYCILIAGTLLSLMLRTVALMLRPVPRAVQKIRIVSQSWANIYPLMGSGDTQRRVREASYFSSVVPNHTSNLSVGTFSWCAVVLWRPAPFVRLDDRFSPTPYGSVKLHTFSPPFN